MGRTEAGEASSGQKKETKQKHTTCEGQERLAYFELTMVPCGRGGSAGDEAQGIFAPPSEVTDHYYDSLLCTISLYYISISPTLLVLFN